MTFEQFQQQVKDLVEAHGIDNFPGHTVPLATWGHGWTFYKHEPCAFALRFVVQAESVLVY